MPGVREQRPALQRAAGGSLRPLEPTVRLGLWHEHHRHRTGRDGPARVAELLERYGDRFLRRVFTDGRLPIVQAPRPGSAPGGPVCRQGSGDESARHRPLARRGVEGHRGRPRRRSAASAVSRAAPPGAPMRWVCRSPRDHYPLGDARVRAGHAPRRLNAALRLRARSRGSRCPAPRNALAPTGGSLPTTLHRAWRSRRLPATRRSFRRCDFRGHPDRARWRQRPCLATGLTGDTIMTVKIVPNDKGNPPGKLADAELHFTDGPLEGLKLIGFARLGAQVRQRPQRHVPRAAVLRQWRAAQLRAAAADRATRRRRTASASCPAGLRGARGGGCGGS